MTSNRAPASFYDDSPILEQVDAVLTELLTWIGCDQVDLTLPLSEQMKDVVIMLYLGLFLAIVTAIVFHFLSNRFSTVCSSADPTIPIVWSHTMIVADMSMRASSNVQPLGNGRQASGRGNNRKGFQIKQTRDKIDVNHNLYQSGGW